MHDMLICMDIFHNHFIDVHLAALPRRFATSANVMIIGYHPAKVKHERDCFQTYNYSFILKGQGKFYYQGQYQEVKAPCVLTQSPGEPVDYGPDEHWEELFIMYAPDQIATLTAQGLIRQAPPLWHINESAQMHTYLNELLRLISEPSLTPMIDIIDQLCTLLITESILGESSRENREDISVIRAIETYVNMHLHEEIDFSQLADSYHLHPATFRRHWMRYIGIPPKQFLMKQRIQEACRLLAETTMPIGAIAALLNFHDALYFSRKFKQTTGITATTYRQRYHAQLSLGQFPDQQPLRSVEYGVDNADMFSQSER